MHFFEELKQLASELGNQQTVAEMTQSVAASKAHAFTKYCIYKYLILSHPQEAAPAHAAMRGLMKRRIKNKKFQKQAELFLSQIKTEFLLNSSGWAGDFSQLLILFYNYFSGTHSANEAKQWAASLQENRSWLSTACSFMFDACRTVVNYAVQHPVQSTLLVLLSFSVIAAAKQSPKTNIVEVLDDYDVNTQNNYMSTSDKEFMSDSLPELINHKLEVHHSVPRGKVAMVAKKCKDLTPVFMKAIEGEHHSHITRVLTDPLFDKIYCFWMAPEDPESYAGEYDHQNKFITLNLHRSKQEILATINHEAMHADAMLRHTNNKCSPQSGVSASSPVYRVTAHSLKKCNHAFDLGDKRVEEFHSLSLKNPEHLTTEELRRLKTYNEAAAGVDIVETLHASHDLSLYNEMKAKMKSKVNDKPALINIDFFNKKLVNVEVAELRDVINGRFIYKLRSSSSMQAMFMMGVISKHVLLNAYSNLDKGRLLGEREAWTLQSLPPLTAKTFYPEFYDIRKSDIKRCTTLDITPDVYKQRLKMGFFQGEDKQPLMSTEAKNKFS